MQNDLAGQITVYGLSSCDSCRKTQKWLKSRQQSFHFHDLRVDGLDAELLACWLSSELAPKLLNQRSTTWRQLDDHDRASADSSLNDLLLQHPALIKRPVITRGGRLLAVGFNPPVLESLLKP